MAFKFLDHDPCLQASRYGITSIYLNYWQFLNILPNIRMDSQGHNIICPFKPINFSAKQQNVPFISSRDTDGTQNFTNYTKMTVTLTLRRTSLCCVHHLSVVNKSANYFQFPSIGSRYTEQTRNITYKVINGNHSCKVILNTFNQFKGFRPDTKHQT